MTLAIAFAATSRAWQQQWNRYLHSFAVDETVAAVVADPRDLYAEEWRVLVIDADSAWLTADFVDGVHDQGRGVVAVVEPGDEARARRAQAASVDLTVLADADPTAYVAGFYQVAQRWPAAARPSRARVTRTVATGGQVIAVGGAPGAGADRIAVGLATLLNRRRQSVVLVDADEVSARLAIRLDLSPQPNIATAALRPEGIADEDLQQPEGAGFLVLSGLADPAQWATLNPRGVRRTIDALAARFDRVIVLVGPVVEPAPRFALTAVALGRAEAVVPVGEATPDGLDVMVTWVANAAKVAVDAPFYPVATHVSLRRAQRADVASWLAKVTAGVNGADTVTLVPAPDGRQARGRWDQRLVKQRSFLDDLGAVARAVTA